MMIRKLVGMALGCTSMVLIASQSPANVAPQPEPHQVACKPNGASVSMSTECCSGKARYSNAKSSWVCCSGGSGCS